MNFIDFVPNKVNKVVWIVWRKAEKKVNDSKLTVQLSSQWRCLMRTASSFWCCHQPRHPVNDGDLVRKYFYIILDGCCLSDIKPY